MFCVWPSGTGWTQNRLLRYFDGVFVQNEDYYCTLFEIYRDYLDAAYALGRCMEHSAVLWPEQLYTAHDVAVAELAEKQARTEGSRRAASLKARRLKYEFELDGLRIVFPATAGAIRREGKTLAHCVGGYAERHLSGSAPFCSCGGRTNLTRPTSPSRWTAIKSGRSTGTTTIRCRAAPSRGRYTRNF